MSTKSQARVIDVKLFKVSYLTHTLDSHGEHTTGDKVEFFLAESIDHCLELAQTVGLIDTQDTLEVESVELVSRRLVVAKEFKGI